MGVSAARSGMAPSAAGHQHGHHDSHNTDGPRSAEADSTKKTDAAQYEHAITTKKIDGSTYLFLSGGYRGDQISSWKTPYLSIDSFGQVRQSYNTGYSPERFGDGFQIFRLKDNQYPLILYLGQLKTLLLLGAYRQNPYGTLSPHFSTNSNF